MLDSLLISFCFSPFVAQVVEFRRIFLICLQSYQGLKLNCIELINTILANLKGLGLRCVTDHALTSDGSSQGSNTADTVLPCIPCDNSKSHFSSVT